MRWRIKKNKNIKRSEDEEYVEAMVFFTPEKEREKKRKTEKKLKSLNVWEWERERRSWRTMVFPATEKEREKSKDREKLESLNVWEKEVEEVGMKEKKVGGGIQKVRVKEREMFFFLIFFSNFKIRRVWHVSFLTFCR